MRLLILALVLIVPSQVLGQTIQCPGCVIGVFDDPGLSRNFGFWDASTDPIKSVWVGITFDRGLGFGGMTGVEFSVDGMARFHCRSDEPCYSYEGLEIPNITIGPSIAAPEDKENGQGGVEMAGSAVFRVIGPSYRSNWQAPTQSRAMLSFESHASTHQAIPSSHSRGSRHVTTRLSHPSPSPVAATSSTQRLGPVKRLAIAR